MPNQNYRPFSIQQRPSWEQCMNLEWVPIPLPLICSVPPLWSRTSRMARHLFIYSILFLVLTVMLTWVDLHTSHFLLLNYCLDSSRSLLYSRRLYSEWCWRIDKIYKVVIPSRSTNQRRGKAPYFLEPRLYLGRGMGSPERICVHSRDLAEE